MKELNTIEEYRQELEKQTQLVAALLEGQPSGLNVHQARMLLGNLEKENQKLQETLKSILPMITRLRCRCAFDYCDRCTMLALINSVINEDENERISYEESKIK